MRMLVVGGTGFIGSSIVRQLADAGHSVTVFNRGLTAAALPESVEQVLDPESTVPIRRFPKELAVSQFDSIILTLAMGAPDSQAAMEFFHGNAGRIVLLSSGDVYRAYGQLTRMESGPVHNQLLTEESPFRSVLFPYRHEAPSRGALEYWYEKILAERAVMNAANLPGVVVRLPKVYGLRSNHDLATVYRNSHHPNWRWTHGYVENVAAAVALAATHPAAVGRIYNVGEADTPTIGERLHWLPPSSLAPDLNSPLDFRIDMAYDTTRIRSELGYTELIREREAVLLVLSSQNR